MGKEASNRMGSNDIPVDSGQKPGAPEGEAGPIPGPETSPGSWHSITVSPEGPEVPEDNEVLERSFQELVRYYRHSSVGRRCLGIVHQMKVRDHVIKHLLNIVAFRVHV